MWLVDSLLVGTLAVHRGDLVFIALQISSLTSAAIILFLAQRYRGMVCAVHRLPLPPRKTVTGPEHFVSVVQIADPPMGLLRHAVPSWWQRPVVSGP